MTSLVTDLDLKTLNRDLYELEDKEFQFVVDQELRKDHLSKSPQSREILQSISSRLREPDVLDRWYFALLAIKNSAESQLGARRADLKSSYGVVTLEEYLEKKRRHENWKGGTLRFLSACTARILECRMLRQREFVGNLPNMLEHLRTETMELAIQYETSIVRHKQIVVDNGMEATEADEELWSSVESRKGRNG